MVFVWSFGKLCNSMIDYFPPFWWKLSAIKNLLHNSKKNLVSILEKTTASTLNIINSFDIGKELINKNQDYLWPVFM